MVTGDELKERGSVPPHPPGPSPAATTSDVRPRLTFFVSSATITPESYILYAGCSRPE
jgi:hypothetical protein